jgi:hypothetical protein
VARICRLRREIFADLCGWQSARIIASVSFNDRRRNKYIKMVFIHFFYKSLVNQLAIASRVGKQPLPDTSTTGSGSSLHRTQRIA